MSQIVESRKFMRMKKYYYLALHMGVGTFRDNFTPCDSMEISNDKA